MLALLTLPRGVPVEPALELVDGPREEPVVSSAWPGDGVENDNCFFSRRDTEEPRTHRLS